jgi:hypothetical protein
MEGVVWLFPVLILVEVGFALTCLRLRPFFHLQFISNMGHTGVSSLRDENRMGVSMSRSGPA